MIDDKLAELVEKCVRLRGTATVEKRLASLLLEPRQPEEAILTIVANCGVHIVPAEYLRGEVYCASHGNWDASSQKAVNDEFSRILRELGHKLRERVWKKIYFVPTGHPALAIQIKIFVYRVARINTVDLFYQSGKYYEIDLNHREIVLGTQE